LHVRLNAEPEIINSPVELVKLAPPTVRHTRALRHPR
jgi:hypothetical protein